MRRACSRRVGRRASPQFFNYIFLDDLAYTLTGKVKFIDLFIHLFNLSFYFPYEQTNWARSAIAEPAHNILYMDDS